MHTDSSSGRDAKLATRCLGVPMRKWRLGLQGSIGGVLRLHVSRRRHIRRRHMKHWLAVAAGLALLFGCDCAYYPIQNAMPPAVPDIGNQAQASAERRGSHHKSTTGTRATCGALVDARLSQ